MWIEFFSRLWMSIETVWVSFFNFFAALKKFPTNCGILSNDLFCEIKKNTTTMYVLVVPLWLEEKNIKLYTNTYREFAWIWNTEFCVYQINICGYYLSIIFIDFFSFCCPVLQKGFRKSSSSFSFYGLEWDFFWQVETITFALSS